MKTFEPTQTLLIRIIGDNPDFADEALATAVRRINDMRIGGDLVVDATVVAPHVRKAWIGWWVNDGWCPTRAVRDHAIKRARYGPTL